MRHQRVHNMVEIISEFVLKEEARGRFELAYGPGGAWSQLFARSVGFRGITLLRGIQDRRRYLMFEIWESAAQRAQALAERQAEYAALDAALAGWCESRTEVGAFTMLAEAMTRPTRGARR